MRIEKRRPFNKRAFVTLMAAIAGIGLPLSGLANHILQSDPIALYRHAWMAAHWSMGILFVVFAVWHVILNRRTLLKYMRSSALQISALSRELILAVALVSTPVFLAVIHAFIAD